MVWEAMVDFVYPKTCVGCGTLEKYLCEECVGRLDFVDQICPMCGEASAMGWTHTRCKSKYGMDGLIALYEYQEPVARAVVDGIKYGFNRELVGIVLKDMRFEMGEKFDLLVPVPLHFYRENWRGFNQAAEIGQFISLQTTIPLENVLKRVKKTKQQVNMKTREERELNIKGAFKINEKSCLAGRQVKNSKLKKLKILLVDDVFTSGADMRECTKMLKKAGVEIVWGLALAH